MRDRLQGQSPELDRHPPRGCHRCGHKGKPDHRHQRSGKPPSEQPIDGGPDQRQQRNQPEVEVHVHSFSRFTSSTFNVSRVRKIEMMIASPTAASAAATTITKNTNTCPLSRCQCAANATKDRFTPFSINSIEMKIVMMLRLIRNPATPHEKSMALRIR